MPLSLEPRQTGAGRPRITRGRPTGARDGLPWGLKRLFIVLDPFMALLQFRSLRREIPQFSAAKTFLAGNPMIPLFDGIWYSWLANLAFAYFTGRPLLEASTAAVVR